MIGYGLALLMGIILGLLGGGGSILTVPILVYIFNIPASVATGYSLFVVGLTSAITAIRFRKHFKIGIGILFAIPSTIGVVLSRRYLLQPMPDQVNWWLINISKDDLVMLVFGGLVVITSLFMFKAKEPENKETDIPKRNALSKASIGLIVVEGLLVGGLTGFVGAGGGFMIVPALTLLIGIPMRSAIATSLLIISIKSFVGFIGDIRFSESLNWLFLWRFSSITVVGGLIGYWFNQRVSPTALRQVFAFFVFIIGINIIIFH